MKAELLIQKSAKLDIDLNAKDQFDATALFIACFHGKLKAVKVMIEYSKYWD